MSDTATVPPPSSPQPQKGSTFLDPKANAKGLIRILLIVVVLIGFAWFLVRHFAGEKEANKMVSTVLKSPIELKNSVENLPASSFKWVSLSLPYTGTLTVEVRVLKGNDVDIYIIQPDEIDNIKTKRPFKYLQDFDAQKTKNFRRSARLQSGNYYLVLMDKTLGLISKSSSDVQIKA